MKTKFTDSFIKGAEGDRQAYSRSDTEHRGLMMRISATGGQDLRARLPFEGRSEDPLPHLRPVPGRDARRRLPSSCGGAEPRSPTARTRRPPRSRTARKKKARSPSMRSITEFFAKQA